MLGCQVNVKLYVFKSTHNIEENTYRMRNNRTLKIPSILQINLPTDRLLRPSIRPMTSNTRTIKYYI